MAEQTYTYTNESFSGCDMVATMVVPSTKTGASRMYSVGEIQTISYSIHQDRRPVRSIGNINAKDYVMGQRTIAGSLVFAVFNKHFAYKIMKDLSEDFNNGYAFLIDEIPPFNIILSLANEYGLRSKLVIYGIRLINEGQVMSINDIYTENTYQFVATDIEYLNNENEYSKGGSSSSGYIIQDVIRKESDITEPPEAEENNDDNNNENVADAILKYSINYNEKIYKDNKLGRYVKFWLTPEKQEGYVIIKSTDNKINININIKQYINTLGNITLPLYEGEYTAKWVNEDEYSNEVSIAISNVSSTQNSVKGPLIENIADKSVSLLSATPNHTKLIYGIKDIDMATITLTPERRVSIKNLSPDTEYCFATSNSNNTETSKYVKARTEKLGHDAYLEFLEYLRVNKRVFKINDFTIYESCVFDTRALAKNTNFKTLPEAFNVQLKKYISELSSLTPDIFNNILDYQEKVTALSYSIDGQRHILRILSEYISDKINGLNETEAELEEKEKSSSTAEIYTIEDNSYKQHETDYNIADVFEGDPDTIYYINEKDEDGIKAPTKIIYSPDYDQKSAWTDEDKIIEKEIEYIINSNKDNLNYNIIDNYNYEDIKRFATETALSGGPNYIAPPMLTASDKKTIKVVIDEHINNLKNNKIMAVISHINEALNNRKSKYKVILRDQNEVTFTSKEHAIIGNEIYYIWLENESGVKISRAISVKTEKDLNQYKSEFELPNYYCKEFIEIFKSEFPSYNKSTALKYVLNKNYEILDSYKGNVFINILTDMSLNINSFGDLYNILFNLCSTFIEYNYTVDKRFFEKKVIFLNNRLEHMIVSNDCYMHIINFSSNYVISNIQYVSKSQSFKINTDSNYTIIYFTSTLLNSVSGVILIDNMLKQYKCYNISAEVDSNDFTK